MNATFSFTVVTRREWRRAVVPESVAMSPSRDRSSPQPQQRPNSEPRRRRLRLRREVTDREGREQRRRRGAQRRSTSEGGVVTSLTGWDRVWLQAEEEREERQQVRGGPRRRSRGADDTRRGFLSPTHRCLMSIPLRRPIARSETSSEFFFSLQPPPTARQLPRRMAGEPTEIHQQGVDQKIKRKQ